jgi:Fur family transcriptional regulator, ferric uptake regulator
MKPLEILNSHKLKRTSCREGIIHVILTANNALSENEIRERLEGNYDRTTFYRSFKTLEEHKIIHKIVVDNQVVKYALDNRITQKPSHAHFYCTICETVKCLDTVPLGIPQLPGGFNASETEMIIKGSCNLCNTNK